MSVIHRTVTKSRRHEPNRTEPKRRLFPWGGARIPERVALVSWSPVVRTGHRPPSERPERFWTPCRSRRLRVSRGKIWMQRASDSTNRRQKANSGQLRAPLAALKDTAEGTDRTAERLHFTVVLIPRVVTTELQLQILLEDLWWGSGSATEDWPHLNPRIFTVFNDLNSTHTLHYTTLH